MTLDECLKEAARSRNSFCTHFDRLHSEQFANKANSSRNPQEMWNRQFDKTYAALRNATQMLYDATLILVSQGEL